MNQSEKEKNLSHFPVACLPLFFPRIFLSFALLGLYDDFVKLAFKVKDAQTNSVVFFYSDPYSEKQGIFVNPPESAIYNNQWVLIPRKGKEDFSEVQRYVECEIKVGNCPVY